MILPWHCRSLTSSPGEGSGLQLHNLEVIRYCPHTGTHMDSPFHVCSEWGSMETVDPAVLIGPATVLSLTVPEYDYAVTREDIEQWEAEFGKFQKATLSFSTPVMQINGNRAPAVTSIKDIYASLRRPQLIWPKRRHVLLSLGKYQRGRR